MPFIDKSTLVLPATSSFPGRRYTDTRDPTSSDFRQFQISDMWINTANSTFWVMVDRTATSGTWSMGGSTGTGILTITGDSGGPVGADGANNINLVTGAGLTIAGNAGTNTLTATLDASVPTSFVEDAGSATPSANVLKIVGAGGVTTSGAGNTVTITAGVTVPTTFTENAGTATPAGNNLNILGGTLCSTSGAGSTVTINVSGTVASTYTADSGTATPSANNLNVFGGGGTSTSASGSTITITSTGAGFSWNTITVVGPTTMSINNGYISNSASTVQLLLPATAVVGSALFIVGKGTGGWQINQAAGQQILAESSSTSVGVLGTVNSSNQRDTMLLLCTTANTTWTAISGFGNWIFT